MIERFKIAELADSILAVGYNAFDPIIAWDRGIVAALQGNRRLAANQLLLDPDRAPERHQASWRQL